MSANNETITALLKAKALLSSARRTLSRKARVKAPLGANSEAIAASLKTKALLDSAKLAFSTRAKALKAKTAYAKLVH